MVQLEKSWRLYDLVDIKKISCFICSTVLWVTCCKSQLQLNCESTLFYIVVCYSVMSCNALSLPATGWDHRTRFVHLLFANKSFVCTSEYITTKYCLTVIGLETKVSVKLISIKLIAIFLEIKNLRYNCQRFDLLFNNALTIDRWTDARPSGCPKLLTVVGSDVAGAREVARHSTSFQHCVYMGFILACD